MNKLSLIASTLSLLLLVGCAMPEKKGTGMMDTEKMERTQEMMMDEDDKKMMDDKMKDTM
jgi:hypothetical protein